MVEKRELVCIACPLGCHLQVTLEAGKVTKVEGKGCKRGIIYAEAECMHPARMLHGGYKGCVYNGTGSYRRFGGRKHLGYGG